MEIKLTGDIIVFVDDEDINLCRNLQVGRDGLVYSRWRDGKKHISIGLHRLIMNCPENLEVDHKDGNPLNNRKSNLRTATRSENACNRGPQKKINDHPYKGIKFHKRPGLNKRWQAVIKKNGIVHSLGYFLTAAEAAEAYDRSVEKYHGEFGKKNEVF